MQHNHQNSSFECGIQKIFLFSPATRIKPKVGSKLSDGLNKYVFVILYIILLHTVQSQVRQIYSQYSLLLFCSYRKRINDCYHPKHMTN